jgi:peptidoglycan-associated lipoprotein
MRIITLLTMTIFSLTALGTVSCTRNHDEVWEDTKTCSRHVGRGFRALGGKHGDSRQVQAYDDFYQGDQPFFSYEDHSPSYEQEFVPLQDEHGNDIISLENARAPSQSPGDPGSSIPGIEAFRDPSSDPELAAYFRNIQFEYNSSLVKGEQNLSIIRNISGYLNSHPHTHVFVEGHCDERGPAAFNYALGSRRANAVRNLLIQEGVNPDNVYTISYGKDRPIVAANEESAWSLNRRAQFKVYD